MRLSNLLLAAGAIAIVYGIHHGMTAQEVVDGWIIPIFNFIADLIRLTMVAINNRG